MITYSIEMVRKAIEEAAGRFVMTRALVFRDIQYRKEKKVYLVVLSDGTRRIIPKELVNTYIESIGDKGALEIAGHLLHSVELEQSFDSWVARTNIAMDEYWDGDMNDVIDYLDKKEKKRLEGEEGKEGS